MNTWPEESKIRKLLGKAMSEAEDLDKLQDHEMTESFDKIQNLMDTPIQGRNEQVLLLSAVILHTRKVERWVLEAMRMDRWVSSRVEAILVNVRLICAEIIGILTNASDELRLVPVRAQTFLTLDV